MLYDEDTIDANGAQTSLDDNPHMTLKAEVRGLPRRLGHSRRAVKPA